MAALGVKAGMTDAVVFLARGLNSLAGQRLADKAKGHHPHGVRKLAEGTHIASAANATLARTCIGFGIGPGARLQPTVLARGCMGGLWQGGSGPSVLVACQGVALHVDQGP